MAHFDPSSDDDNGSMDGNSVVALTMDDPPTMPSKAFIEDLENYMSIQEGHDFVLGYVTDYLETPNGQAFLAKSMQSGPVKKAVKDIFDELMGQKIPARIAKSSPTKSDGSATSTSTAVAKRLRSNSPTSDDSVDVSPMKTPKKRAATSASKSPAASTGGTFRDKLHDLCLDDTARYKVVGMPDGKSERGMSERAIRAGKLRATGRMEEGLKNWVASAMEDLNISKFEKAHHEVYAQVYLLGWYANKARAMYTYSALLNCLDRLEREVTDMKPAAKALVASLRAHAKGKIALNAKA